MPITVAVSTTPVIGIAISHRSYSIGLIVGHHKVVERYQHKVLIKCYQSVVDVAKREHIFTPALFCKPLHLFIKDFTNSLFCGR